MIFLFGGKFGGKFAGFYFGPTNKGSKISGKISEKIRSSKQIFRANFVLQTCHPNLVASNFYAEALLCTLLRSFALFCGLAFALICVFLRPTAFRNDRVQERLRSGTAEEDCQMAVSLRMIWGFGGPVFRTSWQSSVCPRTLLRCLEKWSTLPHRAPVAQNVILGPNTPNLWRPGDWQSLIAAFGIENFERSIVDWNFRSSPSLEHHEGRVDRNTARLKFSIEIEVTSFRWRLKISGQDWNFRSGLNFFDRRPLWACDFGSLPFAIGTPFTACFKWDFGKIRLVNSEHPQVHPTMTGPAHHHSCPEGPAKHLNASQQRLTPHCLAAILELQLPSPELSLKVPPKSPPQERGFFWGLFQESLPRRGQCGTWAAKLSRGYFCLAAFRGLSGPSESPLRRTGLYGICLKLLALLGRTPDFRVGPASVHRAVAVAIASRGYPNQKKNAHKHKLLLWWGSNWLRDNRPVNRTKKFMCSPPNQGNKHFLLVEPAGCPGVNRLLKKIICKC